LEAGVKHWRARRARLLLTSMLVFALSAVLPATAGAATGADSGKPVPIEITVDCNNPIAISPWYANVNRGQWFTVNVYWACQDTFDVHIHMHWGNGGYERYQCWANCSSGSTSFSTIFWSGGVYYSWADITNSQRGGYTDSRQNVS
jgi:hypothetical protein